jgi:hypothetical protein
VKIEPSPFLLGVGEFPYGIKRPVDIEIAVNKIKVHRRLYPKQHFFFVPGGGGLISATALAGMNTSADNRLYSYFFGKLLKRQANTRTVIPACPESFFRCKFLICLIPDKRG